MDVNVAVKSGVKIRAFYLFFLMVGAQLGVGTIGASRYIFTFAKQDSWISILIALLFMMLTVVVMFYILDQYENADIFGIQVDVFGSFIGKILGTVYIIYFGAALVSVLLTYIEIIQVFLYPTFPAYVISFLSLSLAIYCIFGGIRVITGAAFIFILLTQPLLFLLIDPATRMYSEHFLPILQASPQELLQGAWATTYTLSGFEMLFLIYPFIKNKEKAKLPTFLGIAYSAFILFITTIILIGYYSLRYIQHIESSLITLFKSISFTFLERIDYFVIAEWMMVILPNNILLMWGMTYGLKRLYSIKQRHSIFILAAIILVIVSIIKYDYKILRISDYVGQVGFWLIFVYPFVLLPCVMIKKKWRKKKGMEKP